MTANVTFVGRAVPAIVPGERFRYRAECQYRVNGRVRFETLKCTAHSTRDAARTFAQMGALRHPDGYVIAAIGHD